MQYRPIKNIAALSVAFLLALFGTAVSAFSLDDVTSQARELARAPYRAEPPASTASWLSSISYDEYRSIRFKPQRATWRDVGLPFEIQYFHVGRGNTRPVKLFELTAEGTKPLMVSREAFDYGTAKLPPTGSADAEVAGFRVHFPVNRPDYKDEVIAFLGASYFRAVGAKQAYGLSARGIAVDTVGGQRGEEFPAFESFWIERPARNANALTIYALLNGPRVTGAYRFTVRPGASTVVDVQARIFLREAVAKLGVAPLTSMFLSGENQPAVDDFRPEVHDSDGLQIVGGDGEWIWRPLTNPKQPFVTSFSVRSPRGFGLLQRDRAFPSYEDLEARYDRRPSAWIEPQGDWGAGRIELLQYHTPDETHDNVAAYWVPEKLPPAGEALSVGYRMHWRSDDAARATAAHVAQSRRGQGYREGKVPPDAVQFHVDFVGSALEGLGGDASVEAVVNGDDNVSGLRAQAYPNPVTGGWRVTLDFRRRDAKRPVELRAFLRQGQKVLSETWSYALPPEQ